MSLSKGTLVIWSACTALVYQKHQTKPPNKLTTTTKTLQQQNPKQTKKPTKQKESKPKHKKENKKGGAGREWEREDLPPRFLLNSAMRQNAPFLHQPWTHTRLAEFWTMSSHFTHCWWANWCTLQCLREGLQQPQGWKLQLALWEVQELLSCVISHFSLFITSGGLCRATCSTGTQVTGTVSTFLSFTASRRSHDKQVSCRALKMRPQQRKDRCPNKLFSCYIVQEI